MREITLGMYVKEIAPLTSAYKLGILRLDLEEPVLTFVK